MGGKVPEKESRGKWFSGGQKQHNNENAVIEASSTFHRRFIEFFVAMHEIFDDGINFSWKYPFRNFLKKN